MDIILIGVAIVLAIVGVIGSVMPVLPGPFIGYVGMGVMYLWVDGARAVMTPRLMVVMLVLMIVISIVDYIIPMITTKLGGGSKAAARGSVVGMIVGLFLTPVGMILGSLLGAFLAELLIERKEIGASLKSAFASFVGFLLGSGFKLILSMMMLYYIVRSIIG